ncbi:dienelactone hydrolase family protein [Halopelagius longus]|uniref:Alpha/beta hydrolase n=1 Tax=Halopelagius longus TaxID=1236180 RepID=A0A1H1FLF9_9EURY|nr:dienelactone hydrolase family protein [Halopelagius longus]RDI70043.1 alpha/beta hydrolase [Halopelagius longus]SDR01755.1 Dienelactone hydrolase [Halopelagius longus]
MHDATDRRVTIPVGDAELEGCLVVPPDPAGLVILVSGGESGSDARIGRVADRLRRAGFVTLSSALLAGPDVEAYATRFDVGLLTERVVAVTEWIRKRDDVGDSEVGYFATGTAAAAAIESALRFDVTALVVLGGRVDRAAESLPDVRSPTLFIVGGADGPVLELNRRAFERLDCEKSLEVVPGAGHRFEGSDELERVAELAAEWFRRHLRE